MGSARFYVKALCVSMVGFALFKPLDGHAMQREIDIEYQEYGDGGYRYRIYTPSYYDKFGERNTLAPAVIAVASEPNHAKLFLNGIYSGVTPYQGILPEGTYTLRVEAAGYPPIQKTVLIDKTSGYTATLLFGFGAIRLESDPSGVDVFVDGRHVGKTPYESARVKTGEHAIRYSPSGYQAFEKTIEVKTAEVVAVSLKLPAASVIESLPKGAFCEIEGRDIRGPSPLTLANLPDGTYRITAIWGESRLSHEVEIRSQQPVRILFDFPFRLVTEEVMP